MTLNEALAWAKTCNGESRTHEALRVLAENISRPPPPEVFQPAPIVMELTPAEAANVYCPTPGTKLPPYGCCPVCLGKTIDGLCGRCSL